MPIDTRVRRSRATEMQLALGRCTGIVLPAKRSSCSKQWRKLHVGHGRKVMVHPFFEVLQAALVTAPALSGRVLFRVIGLDEERIAIDLAARTASVTHDS